MGWGESEGKLALAGYNSSYESKQEKDVASITRPELPEVSKITPPQLITDKQNGVTENHKPFIPHKPKKLPAPPSRITAFEDPSSIVTYSNRLTQESYESANRIGNNLSKTNVGRVDLIFNLTPDFMNQWSMVDKNGYSNVNPRTGRVTDHKPMHVVPFKNSGTHLDNIKSQMEEFRSILARKLGVPVNLIYNYKSSKISMDIRPFPKK